MTEQEIEVELEPEAEEPERSDLPVDPMPSFLLLKDGPLKDEARRAWLVPYLVSAEGVLSPNYAQELVTLDQIVKTGKAPDGKLGLTTLPGWKKGNA